MAVGFPTKANWSAGDILTAAQMDDLAGTLNTVQAPLGNAAGKNIVLNGDCSIAQRGTSFTSTGYTLDRWYASISGTTTVSQETTDLPTDPYFRYGIKFVTGASSSFAQFKQALETTTVTALRGKTMTVSGYLKIAGGYTGNWLFQTYYSTSSDALASQTTQIGSNVIIGTSATSSWTRFSTTFTVPTTAAGLMIQFAPDTVQASGVTLRMTGLQLEVGSIATSFQTATGNLASELAACQRYYYRTNAQTFGSGMAFSTTQGLAWTPFPITMRTAPTALEQSGTAADYNCLNSAASGVNLNAVPTFSTSGNQFAQTGFAVASGLVAGNSTKLAANNANAYLGWSAEL